MPTNQEITFINCTVEESQEDSGIDLTDAQGCTFDGIMVVSDDDR